MAIFYGGKIITPSINKLQQTDFSKVTTHPEFVVAGKTFYDETGQLKKGTSYMIDPSTGKAEGKTLLLTVYAKLYRASAGTYTHIIGCAVNRDNYATYHEFDVISNETDTDYTNEEKVAEITELGAADTVKIYTVYYGSSGGDSLRVGCKNCVASLKYDDNYAECEITVSEIGADASVTIEYNYS